MGLLVEAGDVEAILQAHAGVPLLVVDDWASALGPLAHAALGYPARSVNVSGITGTNGKTTIAGLVRQCCERLGREAASLGTLGYEHNGVLRDLGWTTPPADLVAEIIHEAREAGVNELVMEVSSHALSLGRVDGLRFKVAGYINLTQDHLDFHHTFEEYAAAKRRLFTEDRTDQAVINSDDPELLALSQTIAPSTELAYSQWVKTTARVCVCSTSRPGWMAVNFAYTFRGEYVLHTKLLGLHNVSNWLVALGMLLARG